MDKAVISVEIVVAYLDEQVIFNVSAHHGATIADVINDSGVLERFPDIDLKQNKVGIFGKAQPLSYQLENKERIEIYRPITCDPKEVRRQRAKKK